MLSKRNEVAVKNLDLTEALILFFYLLFTIELKKLQVSWIRV